MKAGPLILVLALPLVPGNVGAAVIERAGDIGSVVVPAGAALGALFVHDTQGLGQFAKVYGSAMALVYVLKPIVDRTRPDGGHHSFPSGHTASAFAGAAFLQRRYGWGFGAPAYALATFVGWSRVDAKRHYTSDVIAGGAIGVGANLVFTRPRGHASIGVGVGNRAGSVTIAW